MVGLLAFFAVIITIFIFAFRNRQWFKQHPRQDAVWLGLHASLVGALVAGVLDHYLFNLEFHHAVTAFWLIIGLAVAATRLGTVPQDLSPLALQRHSRGL